MIKKTPNTYAQIHKTGSCGIAYIGIKSESAYNIVGSKCGLIAMAHELGHNMGLSHSPRQKKSTSTYPFGLGYGVNGIFATIMTGGTGYKARIVPNFSNPRMKCKGLPCGESNRADANRAMHLGKKRYAEFRPTKILGGSNSSTNSSSTNNTNTNNRNNTNKPNQSLVNGTYIIKAKHSGKCVNVYSAATKNKTNVNQWNCHRANNQRWLFNRLSGGNYRIRAKHSNKCMTVAGYSLANGGNIHQSSCHNGANQKWRVVKNNDGSYRLANVHSNKVAAVSHNSIWNGVSINQSKWLGAANQKFTLERIK